MNASRLLEHFDRISEAPDAIPKLRKFILDLAVRGKLVEQDSGEAPASELLAELGARNGRSRQESAPADPIDAEDEPFGVPSGWQWCRFADIARIESRLVSPKDHPDSPHIAPDNIESGTGRLLPYESIRSAGVFSAKHLFRSGRLLYSKIRPALAKVVAVDFDGLCSADMYPILPLIDRGYLLRYMLSATFVQQSLHEDTRVAMPKINQAALSKILVPLPPLGEQRRIVAKVDELMGLCDRLEEAQTHTNRLRRQLAAGSRQETLADRETTTAARPPFVLEHMSRMTTEREHVAELRASILGLAVRGRLLAQDSRDEPAASLLRRVGRERVSLGVEGKIRKQKPLPPVGDLEQPFDIPDNWAWTRLGEIGDWGSGSTPPRSTAEYYGGELTWLKSGELGDNIALRGSEERVTELALAQCSFRLNQPGDVLMAMYGATIGKLAILAEAAVTNQAVCGCTPFAGISNRYLFLFLLSQRASFHAQSEGGAQPNVSKDKIVMSPFACPPPAEQLRIVSKVDELMSLCDQLDEQITVGEEASAALLNALLLEALDSGQRAPFEGAATTS